MSPEGERLVVGLVRGVHGLDGTVRVEPLSDNAGRFAPGSSLYPEGSERRLTVEWAQADAPGILVRFREAHSRDAADGLRNVYLEAIAPSRELGPDEYWWHEVIGVPVTTASGEALGQVDDVFRTGGGEVYVVRGGPRGEVLVPAVRSVIREFAPRRGRLVVDAEALGLEDLRPRRRRGRRASKAGPIVAAGEDAGEPVSGEPATLGLQAGAAVRKADGTEAGGTEADGTEAGGTAAPEGTVADGPHRGIAG
ncbi:MAG: ribosome maturation factor RimM [Candidatus Limnocylindrales bacterium]